MKFLSRLFHFSKNHFLITKYHFIIKIIVISYNIYINFRLLKYLVFLQKFSSRQKLSPLTTLENYFPNQNLVSPVANTYL